MAGLARSTYHHIRRRMSEGDGDEGLREEVRRIFETNGRGGERYGYRRVCAVLNRDGSYGRVNHKKVARLMREMGLKGYVGMGSRKYSSYKGEVGTVSDDLVRRGFGPERPNMVWSTDVTEFRLAGGGAKVYLSPIEDLCSGDIVSHSCSRSPDLDLAMDMLEKALAAHGDLTGLILHSDRGSLYQSETWTGRLESRGIRPSMSRKGNCLDNAKMESFFSKLKKAIWFGRESSYRTPEQLVEAIDDYIAWYNEERIQLGLGGLSPLQHRRMLSTMETEAVQ